MELPKLNDAPAGKEALSKWIADKMDEMERYGCYRYEAVDILRVKLMCSPSKIYAALKEHRPQAVRKYFNKDGDCGAAYDARVKKTPSCWLWTGPQNGGGYGILCYRGGVTVAAHIALERVGVVVEEGSVVYRRCNNKICVRPEHLEVVRNGYCSSPYTKKLEVPLDPGAE
jgi:hypothetical protein